MGMTSRMWMVVVAAFIGASASTFAQRADVGEAFTWQAELTESGEPYTGTADFTFSLLDASSGGAQVGPTLFLSNASLTDGRVVADLDFGGVFDGQERWLAIGVRTPAWDGMGTEPAFTALTPLQPILPTPYSIRASEVDWSGIAGIPAAFADGTDDGVMTLAGAGKAWFDGNIGVFHDDPQLSFSIDRFGANEVGMGQGILSSQGLELLTTDGGGALATRLLIGNNTSSPNVTFYSGASGAEAPTLVIEGSGNVGVGLENPDELLDVGVDTSPRFQVRQDTGNNAVIFGNLTDNGGTLSMSGRQSVEIVIDGNNQSATETFRIKKDGELDAANADILMEVREGGLVVISDNSNPAGANGGLTIQGGARDTPLIVNSDSGSIGLQVNMDAATGSTEGGRFVNDSTEGVGVRGRAVATSGVTFGVWGESDSSTGYGVYGEATRGSGRNYGVYGETASDDPAAYGVFAAGNLGSSGVKTFLIDHPLDPANAYLVHYSAEGPEPQNVYNGVVSLNGDGEAWVDLPDYFGAINVEPRYQLTAIGGPAPLLHVASRIFDNRFLIAGGDPGMEVSWEVKARRNDPGVQRMSIKAVRPKTGADIGRYIQPELYGQPKSASLHGRQAFGKPGDKEGTNDARD